MLARRPENPGLFGRFLKANRERLELSELTVALHSAIPISTYQDLEAGESRVLTDFQAVQLAHVFDLEPALVRRQMELR